MSAAEGWLRARLTGTSPELFREMVEALPDDAPDVGTALAEAAMRIYRRVLDGDGTRADALPLLAADALFTHAFQARAEDEPTSLDEFARAWGSAGRIGEIAT